jgi:hypothetical protein
MSEAQGTERIIESPRERPRRPLHEEAQATIADLERFFERQASSRRRPD